MEYKDIDGEVIYKVFGRMIQDSRIKKKMTQEQFAEKMGITAKYVSKIETGIRGLGQSKLIKCMEILEISPNTFYKPFLNNSNLQKELEISGEISNFTEKDLNIVNNLIKSLKN